MVWMGKLTICIVSDKFTLIIYISVENIKLWLYTLWGCAVEFTLKNEDKLQKVAAYSSSHWFKILQTKLGSRNRW